MTNDTTTALDRPAGPEGLDGPAGKPPARRRRGRGWAIAGLAVILIAALQGGYTLYAFAMTSTRTEEAVVDSPVTSLHVDGDTTDVDVVPAAPGAPVTVRAELTDRDGEARWSHRVQGERLDVTSACKFRLFANFCSVRLQVAVPQGSAVRMRTGTGDLVVEQMGDVDLSTGTGEITMRSVTGPVRATTSTGDVTAQGLTAGEVTARAATGDVTLDFAQPPSRVRANTSTGDVIVGLPDDDTAYRVDTSTSTGDTDTQVPVDTRSERVITASADTGDVRVR